MEATDPPRGYQFSLRVLLIVVTVFGILLALIAPAFFAAREAARRMEGVNKAKDIVLAMQNYSEQNKFFPLAVTRNPQGKAMWGWRWSLVPFVEASNLYNRFDHDRSWDDPSNLALVQFKNGIYDRPGDRNQVPHATNFVVVAGPGTLFPDDGPRQLRDIKDGPENTIILVEIGESDIPWYEPRDLRIDAMSFRINDPDRTLPCVSSHATLGAIVGFADGHVEWLPDDTPPEQLRAMLTIAGGEKVLPR